MFFSFMITFYSYFVLIYQETHEIKKLCNCLILSYLFTPQWNKPCDKLRCEGFEVFKTVEENI